MSRIHSVFQFLKEYNKLHNPVITDLADQKWSQVFSSLPSHPDIWDIFTSDSLESAEILKVRRPITSPCPQPDNSLLEWLTGDWRQADVISAQFSEAIARGRADEESREERFGDDPNRPELFRSWHKKRSEWVHLELQKRPVMDFYNSLYSLYSEIKREGEAVELVLGNWMLEWSRGGTYTSHPLLLRGVVLEFDPSTPEFIVTLGESGTELYTALLRCLPGVEQTTLNAFITEIEEAGYHIADIDNWKPIMSRLIAVLHPQGIIVDGDYSAPTTPYIRANPVLFLRKRTLGFTAFIERVLEDLNANAATPPSFMSGLVGAHDDEASLEPLDENWNFNGIDADTLLTLPANNEQLNIVRHLVRSGAVLVQGPPGTGKTHTIANLIGHLLSQGQSVLVTSHTEKALTVLKDKIFKDQNNPDLDLQSLCVSLLSSKSQKTEMDRTINTMTEKISCHDRVAAKMRISQLEHQREKLIVTAQAVAQQLMQLRRSEYLDLIYDNHTISPGKAAKFVRNGEGSLDFIPGKAFDNTIGLPLSKHDLASLYQTNGELTAEEEAMLSSHLPELDSLWTAEKFREATKEYSSIKLVLAGNPLTTPQLLELEESILCELSQSTLRMQQILKRFDPLQVSLANRIAEDPIFTELWQPVLREMDEWLARYDICRVIKFENEFTIPLELLSTETVSILDEIIASGAQQPINLLTGLIKPRWKRISVGIKNHGRSLQSAQDFSKVRALVAYEVQRSLLASRIGKLLGEISAHGELNTILSESYCRQISQKVVPMLNYSCEILRPFTIALNNIRTPSLSPKDDPWTYDEVLSTLNNTIVPNLSAAICTNRLKAMDQLWADQSRMTRPLERHGSAFKLLSLAIESKDPDRYKAALEHLSAVYDKRDIHFLRQDLLKKLDDIAPSWADAIRARRGIHGHVEVPEGVESAWKWQQLNNQLLLLHSQNPLALQIESHDLYRTLLTNTRELACAKAWDQVVGNITPHQAQALEGWRQTMRQYGKGTGKNAGKFLQQAKGLMPTCQTAIPVWIMSLNRVAESFDPRANKFDVLIIDEASQANILALAALYLGKKIIIVGDEEQVSPEAFGIKSEDVEALISQYIPSIPLNHLYNPRTSIYDLAKQCGFAPIMLTEHFRCLPEIIKFSNELSYGLRIKPLRDASGVTVTPAVVEYRVPYGMKGKNKTNVLEAEHIASLICAMATDPAYKEKTIGVISLLGQEQAYVIEKLLHKYLDPAEYESRRIQCGSSAQFQGDERDIIFLSIVDSPRETDGPLRLIAEEGNNDMNRKRYNVAASRARDQLWVVHSLNPDIDLKPHDIRLRLISHARNPAANTAGDLTVAESDFERQVMTHLRTAGYKVSPQWRVGAYRIDMVITCGTQKVAIECDGDKWHTIDNLPDDIKRQAILERLGWRFIRVRGSAFYRNPDDAMKQIFEELNRLSIMPDYSQPNTSHNCPSENNESSVLSTIKRMSAEIRRGWHPLRIVDSSEALNPPPSTPQNRPLRRQ
ncbi:MAG: AAA family ATPase [Thermaerobacter sp.]|nr:AAA family ATPase [Thermaerobacter sp.]